MKRSINEVESVAFKAARGAGVPLGHAEDFARAVAMLAMTRPQDLWCVTQALDNGEIMQVPLAIDALRCGQAEVPLTGTPLVQAYVDRAALDYGMPMEWTGTVLRNGGQLPAPKATPTNVPLNVWDTLLGYAQRTYVPATEASRAGAGAGAIDND